MGIVDDLLEHPGLYVGRDAVVGSDQVRTARIVVTKLPGGAGVSLDYEVLHAMEPGSGLGHAEHTVIGRADDGEAIMVIAHTHGAGITILRETAPGAFEPGDGPVPYPMKVVVSVPRTRSAPPRLVARTERRSGRRARRRRPRDRESIASRHAVLGCAREPSP